MASQSKRGGNKASATGSSTSSVGTEEALKPFQEAGRKLAEATSSSQETAIRRWGQMHFDLQDAVRQLEQDAHNAVAELNKKFFKAMGQEPTGDVEDAFSSRAKLQLEYESEVRQVYVETQEKLAAISQKISNENAEDVFKQFADQRQEAYREYLGDLQQAWSGTTSPDPQTMSAISLSILSSINTCYS